MLIECKYYDVAAKEMEELDKQKETLGDRFPNKSYTRLRSLIESTLK